MVPYVTTPGSRPESRIAGAGAPFAIALLLKVLGPIPQDKFP